MSDSSWLHHKIKDKRSTIIYLKIFLLGKKVKQIGDTFLGCKMEKFWTAISMKLMFDSACNMSSRVKVKDSRISDEKKKNLRLLWTFQEL